MQKLINKVLRKDRKAEIELYNSASVRIEKILQKRIKCSVSREDVMQDILIILFTKLHQYNSEKGLFEQWLCRIAVNLCNRHHNVTTKKSEYFTVSNEVFDYYHTDNTQDESVDYNKLAKVNNAMDKLKPGQKQIMQLYIMEGYEHSEIAQILDVSIGTSKSQLCRGKERIRTLLTY
jgi:RNA polymerase sigma factor (sigma-70 family)